ncbi:MAG: hypothetical protein EOP51_10980 [Sphingobacteriales bacterium]|nr:MAG: hypothetical protein EOP51_10980 [Sphingobacteriales bacterium]
MKKSIIVLSVLFIGLCMTSCKKSYTCVCDTVQVDGSSEKTSYELKKQTHDDANDFCERYEDDLNEIKPGTTGCHL